MKTNIYFDTNSMFKCSPDDIKNMIKFQNDFDDIFSFEASMLINAKKAGTASKIFYQITPSVYKEITWMIDENHIVVFNEIRKETKKLKRIGFNLSDEISVMEKINNYTIGLKAHIKRKVLTKDVIELNIEDYKEISHLAFSKSPPFEVASDKGFKDAMIIFEAKSAIEKYKAQNSYLLTNDKRALITNTELYKLKITNNIEDIFNLSLEYIKPEEKLKFNLFLKHYKYIIDNNEEVISIMNQCLDSLENIYEDIGGCTPTDLNDWKLKVRTIKPYKEYDFSYVIYNFKFGVNFRDKHFSIKSLLVHYKDNEFIVDHNNVAKRLNKMFDDKKSIEDLIDNNYNQMMESKYNYDKHFSELIDEDKFKEFVKNKDDQ